MYQKFIMNHKRLKSETEKQFDSTKFSFSRIPNSRRIPRSSTSNEAVRQGSIMLTPGSTRTKTDYRNGTAGARRGTSLKIKEDQQVPTSTKPTRFQRLKAKVGALKNLIPLILLLIYVLIGAGVMYLIELKGDQNVYIDLGQNTSNCIRSFNFWRAIYYVNTLYTTIGYGDVHSCTDGGRVVSVILAAFGIPLLLIVLDSTGRDLTRMLAKAWVYCHRVGRFFKRRVRHLDTSTDSLPKEVIRLPISLGVALTICWILICAIFYAQSENWSYFQALYFTIISVTTVGLGDITPKKNGMMILHFVAMIVGLALVSMCIKIVQDNIEQLFQQMANEMQDEAKNGAEQITEPEATDGDSAGFGAAIPNPDINKKKLDRLKHSDQRYLFALMPKRHQMELEQLATKKKKRKIRSVQATVAVDHRSTNTDTSKPTLVVENKGVMTKVDTSSQKTQAAVSTAVASTQTVPI